MRFSDSATARVYSDRDVDPSWIDWCRDALEPRGKVIVDIGCGGGIYSKGFLLCGAKMVYGIDSSVQYVNEAKKSNPDTTFKVAECHKTGLECVIRFNSATDSGMNSAGHSGMKAAANSARKTATYSGGKTATHDSAGP